MRIGGLIANSTNNEAHLQLTGNPTVAAPVNGDVWLNGATFNARLSGTTHNLAAPSNLTIASQAQGDVIYYNGTIWTRLGAGTAGQVLRTQGAAANPIFGYPADLSIASQVQGDVLYFNGSAWVRLAPGTSGQFLRTNGAAANPSWAAAGGGLTLLSTTTLTNVTNSGDITIQASRLYLVFFEGEVNATGTSATPVGIRFNSDSTAGSYEFNLRMVELDGTPTTISSGNSAGTEIRIADDLQSGDYLNAIFYINTYFRVSARAFVSGTGQLQTTFEGDTGTEFVGVFQTGAPTNFEIFASLQMTGSIRVYEYAQS